MLGWSRLLRSSTCRLQGFGTKCRCPKLHRDNLNSSIPADYRDSVPSISKTARRQPQQQHTPGHHITMLHCASATARLRAWGQLILDSCLAVQASYTLLAPVASSFVTTSILASSPGANLNHHIAHALQQPSKEWSTCLFQLLHNFHTLRPQTCFTGAEHLALMRPHTSCSSCSTASLRCAVPLSSMRDTSFMASSSPALAINHVVCCGVLCEACVRKK